MNKINAAKVLFAKLEEAAVERMRGKVDFHSLELLSSTLLDADGRLQMFSGVFVDATGRQAHPFVMSFSTTWSGQRSGLRQFSSAGTFGYLGAAMSFLSVVDYLEQMRVLPCGALEAHIERISHGGEVERAVLACGEYPPFCNRVIKTRLPYDLSLEVLKEAA